MLVDKGATVPLLMTAVGGDGGVGEGGKAAESHQPHTWELGNVAILPHQCHTHRQTLSTRSAVCPLDAKQVRLAAAWQ